MVSHLSVVFLVFVMVLEEYEQNVFLFDSCLVFLFVKLILSCTKLSFTLHFLKQEIH